MLRLSSIIVVLVTMGLGSSLALALDINYPIYQCDKGKLMAVVGYKSRSDKDAYLALYKWTKITHPGQGKVSYPEPIVEPRIVIKRDTAITADYFNSKGARLNIVTEGDEMAGEEERLVGTFIYLDEQGQKRYFRGLSCVYSAKFDRE